MLYYNARYYDPAIGRFISADTVVPGNASGDMDGVALKPLTMGFHEASFAEKLNQESQLDPWYTLNSDEQQQLGSVWGPVNTQSLNRYSYVQNNSLKWTDPSGHWVFSIGTSIRVGAVLGESINIGITFDGHGNVAAYKTTTWGATIGGSLGVSAGGSLLPFTDNIDLTSGDGFNVGASLPTEPVGVGVDWVSDTTKKHQGGSVSVGVGAGADIHIEKSYTKFHGRNLPQRVLGEIRNQVIRRATPSLPFPFQPTVSY